MGTKERTYLGNQTSLGIGVDYDQCDMTIAPVRFEENHARAEMVGLTGFEPATPTPPV